MKNFKLFIFGLLFLNQYFLQAQSVSMPAFTYIDYSNANAVNFSSFDNSYMLDVNDVEGTLYLNDNIENGYIIDTALKNKSKVNLRYDVYNDFFELEVNPNNQELKALERIPRFQYILGGEKFVLIKTDILNEEHYTSGVGYVVELTTPKANAILFKRYYKSFKSGSVSTSSYAKDTKPSIQNKITYIVKLDNKYVKADTHKKKILEAFPAQKQSAIEKFIKFKNFNFRGSEKEIENEMIQLVRYYNSL